MSGLLAYGLGMGAILATLALGIAVLGRGAGRQLRRVSRWVPVAGGLLLVAVGAYLTWYWLADIVSPGHSFALQRLVERIQLDVANPIDAHARLVGGLLGAVVVGAVLAGGLARPGSPRPASLRSAPPPGPAPASGPLDDATPLDARTPLDAPPLDATPLDATALDAPTPLDARTPGESVAR